MAQKCDQINRMSYHSTGDAKPVEFPEAREANLNTTPARINLGFKKAVLSRSHGTWLSRASSIVTTVAET